MILGFKKQFVEPILAGTKIHTIREDKHRRWKVGNKIQFATGVRTKKYKQFSEKVCTGIQRIEMKWTNEIDMICKIDEIDIIGIEFSKLSRNDGFPFVYEFLNWFSKDFTGVIIHWTDFRY